MHANSDLIDLLRALDEAGAKYLIVGGYAFAVHGRTRATEDVDIFIGTDATNAVRVWDALRIFGAPLEELRVEDFTVPETFFIMGRPPNQIDIITTIDGVTFEEAWANRVDSSHWGRSGQLHRPGRAHPQQRGRGTTSKFIRRQPLGHLADDRSKVRHDRFGCAWSPLQAALRG